MRARLLSCLVMVGVICCVVATGTAGANPTYPVNYNGIAGYGHASTPDVPAPGSILVDWRSGSPAGSCHSSAHPVPVVLVNGTFANQADNWAAVSPLLADHGYCVYTANVGGAPGSTIQTSGPIPTSARELGAVIDKVRAATGAPKVDLVGHSQGGGVLPRWYLKYDGGAAKVSQLVGFAPSNHGGSVSGFSTLAQKLGLLGVLDTGFDALQAPALSEQFTGSQLNAELDQGGDTVPGVTYSQIISRNDEVVTPYTNQFLKAGPGATVHNILLQDVCPLDQGDHLSAVYDSVALQVMLNELDPATARTPNCVPVAPVVGG